MLVAAARADGVIPLTLDTMADYAGQVITGEVVSVRSYWAENPRRIESEVTLQNVDYLKGRLSDSKSTFKLIVPGGKVGDWQMQIGCAPTFATGQRWVLFLLPVYKTFPVVGLHQGAFRVEPDTEGVARVYDASGGAVIGIGKDGFFQTVSRPAKGLPTAAGRDGDRSSSAQAGTTAAGEAPRPAPQDNLVAADGVRVRFVDSRSASPQALSYDDFAAVIRPVLERSKAYRSTLPAGQRDLSPYVPVPIKRAPSASGTVGPPSRGLGLRSGGALPRKVDAPQPPQNRQPDASANAKEVRS
ncbi:MAG TPA: hypothetical protein VMV94_19455 [Phycisphaerae bacterium]|nr:hypothetical protein [Phycisphaerae bacterium]